jgi:hypothetical protein
MPLRDVAPLDNKQWEYLMKCLSSKEPKFVKMRARMRKKVREALIRAKEMKVYNER